MTIRRIVPDVKSKRLDDSRAFYVDFLGLKVGMDLGWIVTFVSPSNPTAQISVMRDDNPSTLMPNVSDKRIFPYTLIIGNRIGASALVKRSICAGTV